MPTYNSIYTGNADGDQSRLDQFLEDYETWLGKETWGVSLHTGNNGWDDWSGSIGWIANLFSNINADHQIHWSVHLIPNQDASMQESASGAYNDLYIEAAQTILEASDPQSSEPIYIRTGWEFNFFWSTHSASAVGQEEAYVGAYQQFVESFRSVSDRFLFEWTPNIGTDGSTDVEAAYPGDEYVDIIGMDFYWDSKGEFSYTDPIEAWNYMLTQPYGLNWLTDFAAQHNKPIAISEWGLNSDNAAPYLEAALEWFENNNVLYQNYWESNAAFDSKLSDNQYPSASEAFKYYFGNLDLALSLEMPSDLPAIPDMPLESAESVGWIGGTSEADVLVGTDENNKFGGGGGADIISGGKGDDHYLNLVGEETIIEQAGEGIDSIYTWAVHNTLADHVEHLYLLGDYTQNATGNDLDNILSGGAGNNIFEGNAGNDWITTKSGFDIIEFKKGDGHDAITDFSIEHDRIYIDGFNLSYTELFQRIFSKDGHTMLYLDADNTITFLNLNPENFKLSNFYMTYTAQDIETNYINGTTEADKLRGTDDIDEITGGGGKDYLYGFSGEDTLLGGSENDRMYGMDGDDFMRGELGSDLLEGGDGNDELYGDEGHDRLYGEAGSDLIYGGDGRDKIYAGSDNDVLHGGGARDTMYGGEGDDFVNGEDGNDYLYGDAGNDILIDGNGYDILYGGAGQDLFVLSSTDQAYDQIQDFTLNGPDTDRLNITDLLGDYDSATDTLSDYLTLSVVSENRTDIFISETSDGSNWERKAILRGSDFTGSDVEDLISSGQLIIDETFIV